MMTISVYDCNCRMPSGLADTTAGFLFQHLEHYGDPLGDIRSAIGYAQKETNSDGGFVCLALEGNTLVGAAVVNRTGMERYIPENILVYIAVHKDFRGKGIGRILMKEIIERTQGGIALHVEADNPARKLYESLGFTNKYLEMRLNRKEEI